MAVDGSDHGLEDLYAAGDPTEGDSEPRRAARCKRLGRRPQIQAGREGPLAGAR